MDPRVLRIAIVVVVLAAGGTTAALLTGGDTASDAGPSPTPSASLPSCLPVPARLGKGTLPKWLPPDLTLPAGTYQATFALHGGPTFDEGAFVVPKDLRGFIQHVLSVWPQKGWTLGIGDSEAGEAEDTFFKPRPRINGAFRASSAMCDHAKTLLVVAIGVPRAIAPVAQPTGSSVPLVPGAPPSTTSTPSP